MGGIGWTAFALFCERLISLGQSVYVARQLGAEEFGRYGLVFATTGLIASLAGLQLGLTASVHVSKYVRTAPLMAGAVIRLCEIAGLVSTIAAVLFVWCAPDWVALHLLGGRSYTNVLGVAAVIVLLSVFSGIQDGVLQGFERFRALAIARVGATLVGFLVLLVIGRPGNLDRVLIAITIGAAIRMLAVFAIKEQQWRTHRLKATIRALWDVRGAIFHFSLPSMLASLLFGVVGWYGMLAVSKTQIGFHGVAYVTTGQQWQGTVQFSTAFIASVAVPMMSRMLHEGDTAAAQHIFRANVLLNISISTSVAIAICLLSTFILRAYGPEFTAGYLVFWLIILSTIPNSYIYAVYQGLVARSQMWRQLWLYAANGVPLAMGYYVLVPKYGPLGYAMTMLAVNAIFGLGLFLFTNGNLMPTPASVEDAT